MKNQVGIYSVSIVELCIFYMRSLAAEFHNCSKLNMDVMTGFCAAEWKTDKFRITLDLYPESESKLRYVLYVTTLESIANSKLIFSDEKTLKSIDELEDIIQKYQ